LPISTRTILPPSKNGRAHEAAVGLDGELVDCRQFSCPQVARENAQAVAAFLAMLPSGCKSSARTWRSSPGSGPSKMPSEPTPKLRWQIVLDLFASSKARAIFGLMTM